MCFVEGGKERGGGGGERWGRKGREKEEEEEEERDGEGKCMGKGEKDDMRGQDRKNNTNVLILPPVFIDFSAVPQLCGHI